MYPEIMVVQATTSLSGISSNSVRASLIRPLSKYVLRRPVAKIEGGFGKNGGFEWGGSIAAQRREFLIV